MKFYIEIYKEIIKENKVLLFNMFVLIIFFVV